MSRQLPYRGRFAPSPTGPLHFGSLVAAIGSYLDARANAGTWLLRMEDIDTPRNVLGAADDILRSLEAYGLTWDETVSYQSRRHEYYRDALDRLTAMGRCFPCGCSRRDIGGGPYLGTCRNGIPAGRSARSLRFRVGDAIVSCDDAIQGRFSQQLEREVGDFIVRRAGGLFAYHLAVVVDDIAQGVTNIVRGVDLLSSTPRQMELARALGGPTFKYGHLPIATHPNGAKLSKQTFAPSIDRSRPEVPIREALEFLGLELPRDLVGAEPTELLDWATTAWNIRSVPVGPSIVVDHP